MEIDSLNLDYGSDNDIPINKQMENENDMVSINLKSNTSVNTDNKLDLIILPKNHFRIKKKKNFFLSFCNIL